MLDILIIGSGAAALSAALKAKNSSLTVAIYTKIKPTEANSSMAQGGINAVLKEQNDSVKAHIEDTIKSSCGIASLKMITTLCEQAKQTVQWLENLGVAFSRNDDNTLAQRKLGAASHPRACHAQDFSGLKIVHTLYDSCIKEDIEINEEFFLLNLYPNESYNSATFLDISTSQVIQVEAKNIILATGGYGSIYKGFSTNRDDSVGSGSASALRAGIKLSDLEFVQFHPTSLKSSSILISESARGAGGIIYNENKERFVNELATRDEVSRKIYEELEKGHEVFLDITHLDHEFIEENLPQELKLARTYENINPLLEPIPIKPSAHYSMGGIDVNSDMQTNFNGIFALGECANPKIHGANRLGGNSLLEVLTLSSQAIETIANKQKAHEQPSDSYIKKDETFIKSIYEMPNSINFYEKRELLGELMYKKCGIFRDESSLKEALEFVKQTQKELPLMGIKDKSRLYNTNLIEFLEFINALELSEAIILSALNRKESRGAHYRKDFTQQDKSYEKNQLIWRADGTIYHDFKGANDEN